MCVTRTGTGTEGLNSERRNNVHSLIFFEIHLFIKALFCIWSLSDRGNTVMRSQDAFVHSRRGSVRRRRRSRAKR